MEPRIYFSDEYPFNGGGDRAGELRRSFAKRQTDIGALSPVLFWWCDFPENTMDEKQAPPPQGQVQIKADEKELQGMYSNLVMIHHHAEEFTLNFVYVFPNGPQGKLLASVIVSPGHAKRIWRALGENLARYEAQFGPIKETPEGATPAGNIGFVQ